jgi:hypothetical protein
MSKKSLILLMYHRHELLNQKMSYLRVFSNKSAVVKRKQKKPNLEYVQVLEVASLNLAQGTVIKLTVA